MDVLAIDFASRYSAAVLMGPDKAVKRSWVIDAGPANDPFTVGPHLQPWLEFVDDVLRTVHDPFIVVLEDVSHFMVNPAPALKMQGGFQGLTWNLMPEPIMVKPSVWQKHFAFKKSTKALKAPTTKAQAKVLCAEFGYEFDAKGKAKVDLVDAALIARYGVEVVLAQAV